MKQYDPQYATCATIIRTIRASTPVLQIKISNILWFELNNVTEYLISLQVTSNLLFLLMYVTLYYTFIDVLYIS